MIPNKDDAIDPNIVNATDAMILEFLDSCVPEGEKDIPLGDSANPQGGTAAVKHFQAVAEQETLLSERFIG